MSDGQRIIRVLLGKAGLDGHDRGVKILAQALKDAGVEVIYTGLHRSVAQIVATAVQEDVDVVGVSILSGAHMSIVPELISELRAHGAADKKVVVGGFIPEEDERQRLKELGAAEVFDQDMPLAATVAAVRSIARSRGARSWPA
ncbi:MAG: cobalamin B12-binding domain-containing protein [Gemmatimonadaceae bacterium]|nr:cobalamin B12-binding domain-containing protein [Gemmatimonadaceae bacterium]